MNALFFRLMANKHTSCAALCYGVCFALAKIGTIWFPEYEHKIDASLSAVKDFAVVYGLALGADAKTISPINNQQNETMKNITQKIALLVGVIGASFALYGCANTPPLVGRIVSVTDRGFGIHLSTTSAASQTPEIQAGFFSQTVMVEPVATNTVSVPSFANTFSLDNSAMPFSFGVDETIASGNYQTGSGTNNISAQPIIPK